jgi:hypothetical protein
MTELLWGARDNANDQDVRQDLMVKLNTLARKHARTFRIWGLK